MRKEIKNYTYSCDWCGRRVEDEYALYRVELHDCGLTGYSRTDEVCRACFDKQATGETR